MVAEIKAAVGQARPSADAGLRRLASAIVLAVALVLIVFKVWGWAATGSVALLTSAADAVLDALAAFTQGILLGSTAIVLAAQASWRLIFPQPLTAVTLGSWIALGGLGISGLIVAMRTWVVRRTGNQRSSHPGRGRSRVRRVPT
jgi:divalent metal cation (Fe/Co/Zn/Cd) transporter